MSSEHVCHYSPFGGSECSAPARRMVRILLLVGMSHKSKNPANLQSIVANWDNHGIEYEL